MTQFAPKTVTLTSNTANAIVWGSDDFTRHLGSAKILSECSVNLKVVSTCNQAVYIGLSYITDTITTNAGAFATTVAKNASLTLSAKTIQQLAVLPENIRSLTLSLITVGSGTVTVSLEVNAPERAVTPQQFIGGTVQAADDYLRIFRWAQAVCGPSNPTGLINPAGFAYTVPAGKRAFVEKLTIEINPLPVQSGGVNIYILLNDDPAQQVEWVSSNMYEVQRYVAPTRSLVLNEGDRLYFYGQCSQNRDVVGHIAMMYLEYF